VKNEYYKKFLIRIKEKTGYISTSSVARGGAMGQVLKKEYIENFLTF